MLCAVVSAHCGKSSGATLGGRQVSGGFLMYAMYVVYVVYAMCVVYVVYVVF